MKPLNSTLKCRSNRRYTLLSPLNGNRYHLLNPSYKGLVFSGGGAKGVAYAGVIQALDESNYIEPLTHVGGASIGAIAASFVALGIPAQDIKCLLTRLHFPDLLERSGVSDLWRATGNNLVNVLNAVYMIQVKEHLNAAEHVIPAEQRRRWNCLSSKVKHYTTALDQQGLRLNSISELIEETASKRWLKKLHAATQHQNYQAITFHDLERLHKLLPPRTVKHLNIVVTNQNQRKLEYYGDDVENSRDQSIAQTVQWSAAHPALFVPGRNQQGDYVADGGILNNMPDIPALSRERVLYVKAEPNRDFAKRIRRARRASVENLSFTESVMDSMLKRMLGGEYIKSGVSLINREKILHYLDNMIYIDTGNLTTRTIAITEQQRNEAVQNGYRATLSVINKHIKMFMPPLLATLFFHAQQLNALLLEKPNDPALLHAATFSRIILWHQRRIISLLNPKNDAEIKHHLCQIKTLLQDAELNLSDDDKQEALYIILTQINFTSAGLFLRTLRTMAAEENGEDSYWVLQLMQAILQLLINCLMYFIARSAQNPAQQHAQEEALEEEPQVTQASVFLNFFNLRHSMEMENAATL